MSISRSKKVKQYLVEHGIKTTFIAKEIGLNNAYLGTLLNEYDGREISGDHAIRIAEALGLPKGYFLN